jgi:hypothetical protein
MQKLYSFACKIVLLAIIVGLVSIGGLGQATSLTQPMPVDPQITMGTFPNGLRYYIRPNKKPEKRAELRLVVKAGSILEDDDQRGLAHFVEHMAFNGTKNFPKHELISFIESLGMRFGADINAYTSFDETVYMLQVPTDKPEALNSRVSGSRRLGPQRFVRTMRKLKKNVASYSEEWRSGPRRRNAHYREVISRRCLRVLVMPTEFRSARPRSFRTASRNGSRSFMRTGIVRT